MKSMILALVAVLGLSAAVIPAADARSSISGDSKATQMQRTGTFAE